MLNVGKNRTAMKVEYSDAEAKQCPWTKGVAERESEGTYLPLPLYFNVPEITVFQTVDWPFVGGSRPLENRPVLWSSIKSRTL